MSSSPPLPRRLFRHGHHRRPFPFLRCDADPRVLVIQGQPRCHRQVRADSVAWHRRRQRDGSAHGPEETPAAPDRELDLPGPPRQRGQVPIRDSSPWVRGETRKRSKGFWASRQRLSAPSSCWDLLQAQQGPRPAGSVTGRQPRFAHSEETIPGENVHRFTAGAVLSRGREAPAVPPPGKQRLRTEHTGPDGGREIVCTSFRYSCSIVLL